MCIWMLAALRHALAAMSLFLCFCLQTYGAAAPVQNQTWEYASKAYADELTRSLGRLGEVRVVPATKSNLQVGTFLAPGTTTPIVSGCKVDEVGDVQPAPFAWPRTASTEVRDLVDAPDSIHAASDYLATEGIHASHARVTFSAGQQFLIPESIIKDTLVELDSCDELLQRGRVDVVRGYIQARHIATNSVGKEFVFRNSLPQNSDLIVNYSPDKTWEIVDKEPKPYFLVVESITAKPEIEVVSTDDNGWIFSTRTSTPKDLQKLKAEQERQRRLAAIAQRNGVKPAGPGEKYVISGYSITFPNTVEARSLASPVWNVWFESPYSAQPNYAPRELAIKGDYSLVLNLAALTYQSSGSATYSSTVAPSLAKWLEKHGEIDGADLDVILLPDRRYFEPLPAGEHIKSVHVDLKRMRKAMSEGFTLTAAPMAMLKTGKGDMPFSFGTQVFRLRTTSRAGNAPIALSVWIDGQPIDEISLSVCVHSTPQTPCEKEEQPPLSGLFEGIDFTQPEHRPDAALHLLERQNDLVGVFRCNSCGLARGAYSIWQIGQTATWFTDRVREVLHAMAVTPEAAANVSATQAMESAGDSLSDLLFYSNDQDTQLAAKAVAKFVADARIAAKAKKPRTQTLFVRLIPSVPDLILTPLNIMRVQLADGSREFIGQHVDVQAPLEFQDYTAHADCISSWLLFVPPENAARPDRRVAGDEFSAVQTARNEAKGWINSFQTTCADCVKDNEAGFRAWLGDRQAAPESRALITLSHHGQNSLYFYSEDGSAVLAQNIKRTFASPSFALLDGCGTGEPRISEFIKSLNRQGVNTIIATNTQVGATMAGRFLSLFLETLKEHRDDASFRLSDARFKAVQKLMLVRDKDSQDGQNYGPRALQFMLAGNGGLRVCMPAEVSR